MFMLMLVQCNKMGFQALSIVEAQQEKTLQRKRNRQKKKQEFKDFLGHSLHYTPDIVDVEGETQDTVHTKSAGLGRPGLEPCDSQECHAAACDDEEALLQGYP